MIKTNNVKYTVQYAKRFKKEYKKMLKQGKDKTKFWKVVNTIVSGKELAEKYKNHKLINDKYYDNCMECHIEPDWLLIYKIEEDTILLLFSTGSHSELFKK